MQKVIAIGETILDIIFKDGRPIVAQPGGSALNTLMSLGRMNVPAYFVGELAKDATGDLIIRKMEQNNVSADYLTRYDKGQSGLGLAFLNDNNDAEYSFFKSIPRQRLGDKLPVIEKGDIVLLNSFYGIVPEVRQKILDFIKSAKEKDALIIYDPNFRQSHLDELPGLFDCIEKNMCLADIVRGSHEDFYNIYNVNRPEEAYQKIKKYTPVLLYTKSDTLVNLFTPSLVHAVKVKKIKTMSTVGAGDSFNAGVIFGLLYYDITIKDLAKTDKKAWDLIVSMGIKFAQNTCQGYENYVSWDFCKGFE
jgi:fructokinase